jgi:aryl-alcohol dehydrogenase-like predicted oxidoreductase
MSTKTTDYRLFGRTGIRVSPLTLGTMMFGRCAELDDAVRIGDRAFYEAEHSVALHRW